LQYYFDHEWKLEENPKFKLDIIGVIRLVYEWVYAGEYYAYIELRETFKTRPTGKQAGEALKYMSNLLQNEVNKWRKNKQKPYKIQKEISEDILRDKNGNLKSLKDVLSELSAKWNTISD